MTKPMMDPRVLVEKSADADLLRGMIGFAAEPLMELEVGAKAGSTKSSQRADGVPSAPRDVAASHQRPCAGRALPRPAPMPRSR